MKGEDIISEVSNNFLNEFYHINSLKERVFSSNLIFLASNSVIYSWYE